ncbi:hypothetical protein DD595_26125, partial [Enterobacter cloacae complex sp. 4DZ3-17B2]|uniref:hypothetical protein n=1 Tax=Enterobacter cloacae complex sp. 4DZ3-17B2 TaxID=2511990 RepID=UPI0010278D9B
IRNNEIADGEKLDVDIPDTEISDNEIADDEISARQISASKIQDIEMRTMSVEELNHELVQSVTQGDLTKALKALLRGGDPNHEIEGGQLTPFLLLFRQHFSPTIKHLALAFLEAGADPRARDKYKRTMIHYAAL